MVKTKYKDIRLVEGFNQDKMLDWLNQGYEVIGFTSYVFGCERHTFLLALSESTVTETKKPSKVKSG